jgi:hypothetical protein
MIGFCLGLIVSDGYLFYFIWNKRTKPIAKKNIEVHRGGRPGSTLKIHTEYHSKSKPCQIL